MVPSHSFWLIFTNMDAICQDVQSQLVLWFQQKPTVPEQFCLNKQLPLVPDREAHVRAIISCVKFCISLKAGHDMQIFLYLELYHFRQNLSLALSQAAQIIALGTQKVYTYFFFPRSF